MASSEIQEVLNKLGITPSELASLMSVDLKTVTRWISGAVQLPGPARLALESFRKLNDFGIPWRPDALPLRCRSKQELNEQIALLTEHNIEHAEVLRRVEERGGPITPWKIDLAKGQATLGDQMRVGFYRLPNGGFTPSSYSRSDRSPNAKADRSLLEDAYYLISIAVSAEQAMQQKQSS